MTNVVIPIKNRKELAVQTIESLYEHTPRDGFKFYVYLDGPDQETHDAVMELQRRYGFEVSLNEESKGPGWCRNKICEEITKSGERGEFLYHSDSDVYFMDGWLREMMVAYDKFSDEVKLFGAGSHPFLHTNRVLEMDGVTLHTKDAIPGFTAFMNWETWDKYGPYDEFKGIMGSEDWKFCQDIVKDGHFVASIYPDKIFHCGVTNSDGNMGTGMREYMDIHGQKAKEMGVKML